MIAYCLLEYTNGITQSLDVDTYSPFKSAMISEIRKAVQLYDDPSLEEFNLDYMIRKACEFFLVEAKIMHAFFKSSLWPVNSTSSVSRGLKDNRSIKQ